MSNLEAVFKRFEKHRITLNPSKCRFGASEIEYVGHVINEHGMAFSRDKIDKVLQIPKPVKEKELKSFLGRTDYYSRPHTEPLHHGVSVEPTTSRL